MKLSAALDVDVVALESADELTVLVELVAPEAPTANRPPTALQVVLDRSGSMSGAPLDGAKKALAGVVAQLDPHDVFGVVTFDDTAQVALPASTLMDKQRAVDAISAIETGGCTDLSSGYLRGLQEIRRAGEPAGIRGGTVLVISDGHINSGIRDVDEFAGITAKAGSKGIVTSTMGYGRGYDETLLSAISRAGNGNHVFADNPDAAGAAIAGEVDGLLSKSAQAVTLTVLYDQRVQELALFNDLPAHQIGDGEVMIELGDLYALEERKLLLRMKVGSIAALGLTELATLQLRYVETASLVEHTVSLPVVVNVVPGDEAAGRVPDPKVYSERLYQEGQQDKLEASRAYEAGDIDGGTRRLARSRQKLEYAMQEARPEDRAAIADEIAMLDRFGVSAGALDSVYASKAMRASYHRTNRKRGRRH